MAPSKSSAGNALSAGLAVAESPIGQAGMNMALSKLPAGNALSAGLAIAGSPLGKSALKGAASAITGKSGRKLGRNIGSMSRKIGRKIGSKSRKIGSKSRKIGRKSRKIAGDATAKRIARHYKQYFAKLEAAEAGKQALAADQHAQLKLQEEAARAAGVLSAKKGDRAGQRMARHYKQYFAKLEAAEAGKQAIAADQRAQLKLQQDAAQGAGIIGNGNGATHSGVTGGMIAAGTLATVCVAAIAALAYRARRVAMQSPLLAPANDTYKSLA